MSERAKILHSVCHAPHLMAVPGRPSTPAPESTFIEVKPATWEELHRRALWCESLGFKNDGAWLTDFSNRVPGGCGCTNDWRELMAKNPPDFSRYFEWTVMMHDAVSLRIGRPRFTEKQARMIWGDPKWLAGTPE